MIRLSRYSRGRTDYHSPPSRSLCFLPGSPWEIPREERRSRTTTAAAAAAARRLRSTARHFRFSNRRPYPLRAYNTNERAFAFSRTINVSLLYTVYSISRHVRTILHFPTTACARARSRPPIWRTGYDLIFRVPRRNSLCSFLFLCLHLFLLSSCPRGVSSGGRCLLLFLFPLVFRVPRSLTGKKAVPSRRDRRTIKIFIFGCIA